MFLIKYNAMKVVSKRFPMVSSFTIVISAIHGLNPSGGFPSETVQFGFPYRIV
mgnify:CR=1 FL=1